MEILYPLLTSISKSIHLRDSHIKETNHDKLNTLIVETPEIVLYWGKSTLLHFEFEINIIVLANRSSQNLESVFKLFE